MISSNSVIKKSFQLQAKFYRPITSCFIRSNFKGTRWLFQEPWMIEMIECWFSHAVSFSQKKSIWAGDS